MPNPARAVLLGGLTVGLLDGLYAIIAAAIRTGKPGRVFQSVAGGLIGAESAFAGGAATVALGILLHFTVATLIVLTFYLLSRRLPILTRHPVPLGMAFGLVAYFVMNAVVIPLSAYTRPLFSFRPEVGGVLAHLFLVGLPAALIIARLAPPSPGAQAAPARR